VGGFHPEEAERMTEPSGTPRFRIYFEPLPVYRHEDPLVAAANAGPSWTVEFVPALEGSLPHRRFALWHPMDLAWPQFFKLQAVDQAPSMATLLSGVPDKLKLLMPDLPEEVFHALTANQIVSIAAKAWQGPGETVVETQAREADAANPPAGGRDLATSSRSPLASSPGGMAN
jgi:hypothetical protein